MSKIFITWGHIEASINEIAEWAKDRGFKNIHGISRGGLIPAVMLSHVLGLPLTDKPEKHTTIIIDDIIDSGNTMLDFSHYQTVALFYNKKSRYEPVFFCDETDDWIVFPWETEQSSKVDYKEVPK